MTPGYLLPPDPSSITRYKLVALLTLSTIYIAVTQYCSNCHFHLDHRFRESNGNGVGGLKDVLKLAILHSLLTPCHAATNRLIIMINTAHAYNYHMYRCMIVQSHYTHHHDNM